MNMMKWASDWFEDCRHTHLSSTVTYIPCSQPSIEVKASFGIQSHQTNDESGAVINYETWDFIIKLSELDGHIPQIGDSIYVVDDAGDTYKYDVIQLPNGRCYRGHDRFKDSIVIHADEYGLVEAA